MEQSSAYEGQPLHEPKGWWGRYVFSQDHKVIGLQYTCIALAIGLTGMFLSLLMRMQLGFPGLFESIDAGSYYQDVTMHGMIMVIYLLTALFLGGFGNYLIPLMLGSREGVCLIHRKFLAGFLRKLFAHAGLYRGLLGFIKDFLILKGFTLPMPSCLASWMVSCYASWKVCLLLLDFIKCYLLG